MILLVPAAMPVTIPVLLFTAATPVVPELHVPEGSVSASVVAVPEQVFSMPVMVAGNGFTVTTVLDEQPELSV